jgi:hypothetical protein
VQIRARFSRAAKLIGAISVLLPWSQESPIDAELMFMLNAQSFATRVRNRRYLVSMHNQWADAMSSDRISIFDQGYLSALCSIASRSGAIGGLGNVLERLPKPDVLICVDAPASVIEARLQTRLDQLGSMERRLELDISTTLRQVVVAAELRREFSLRSKVISIDCSGSGIPLRVAQAVVDQIEALPSAYALLPKRESHLDPSLSDGSRLFLQSSGV